MAATVDAKPPYERKSHTTVSINNKLPHVYLLSLKQNGGFI